MSNSEAINALRLAASMNELLTQVLNRRVEVEQYLLDSAAGKQPLPDAATCRALANRLGNPDAPRLS